MTTGEPLGDPMDVLIKPVGFLSEREVSLDGSSSQTNSDGVFPRQ